MPTTVTMPQLGETVVEGTILKWLKKEGEEIGLDEPLFEISTDKVDTEVPSPVAGKIAEIKVQEGETVSVGTELAVIDDGPGFDRTAPIPEGHGIANTRDRLRALYGARASLEITGRATQGTVATLRIPYHEMALDVDDGTR